MNYATIKKNDIANGPGIRVSLFVSGCRHRCKNCFNSEAWDFNYGKLFTDEVVEEIITALKPDYVEGLSLLGGEPFEPENQEGLIKLLETVREKLPDKTVWCYTGFNFESDLLNGNETVQKLLSKIDVLVDGKFVEELKDASLIFRGSSNQNIIDVPKSLKSQSQILLKGKWKRKMGSTDIYDA